MTARLEPGWKSLEPRKTGAAGPVPGYPRYEADGRTDSGSGLPTTAPPPERTIEFSKRFTSLPTEDPVMSIAYAHEGRVLRFGSRRRAKAPTVAPDLRLDLDPPVAHLRWDTHGLIGCTLHWSESAAVIDLDDDETCLPIYNTDHPAQHWWVTGPDGVRSPAVYCYGPRCTVTDLRTRFSQLSRQAHDCTPRRRDTREEPATSVTVATPASVASRSGVASTITLSRSHSSPVRPSPGSPDGARPR